MLLPSALLYRYYFRVATHGIESVPRGRLLLIANHSGQFGYDGAMLAMSMLMDARPPRLCRGMAEFMFWRTPWAGTLASRHRHDGRHAEQLRRHARGGRVRDGVSRGRARREQALPAALPAAAIRARLHAPRARDEHSDRSGRHRRRGGAAARLRESRGARQAARTSLSADHDQLALAGPARSGLRAAREVPPLLRRADAPRRKVRRRGRGDRAARGRSEARDHRAARTRPVGAHGIFV